jgi:hypothetical protein
MKVTFGSASMMQVLGQPGAIIYDKASGTAFQAVKGAAIEGGRLAQRNYYGQPLLDVFGSPQLQSLPNNNEPVYFRLLGLNARNNQPVNLVIPFDGLGITAISPQLDVIA